MEKKNRLAFKKAFNENECPSTR